MYRPLHFDRAARRLHNTWKFRRQAAAGIFSTVRQSCSLIFGSRSSRRCALSRSCVPRRSHQPRTTATSAARIAARRRVVAVAQVTHPAPGYLTRHYTDNRRAATSSPAGWCSLLDGRHQSGTTVSRFFLPSGKVGYGASSPTRRVVSHRLQSAESGPSSQSPGGSFG